MREELMDEETLRYFESCVVTCTHTDGDEYVVEKSPKDKPYKVIGRLVEMLGAKEREPKMTSYGCTSRQCWEYL